MQINNNSYLYKNIHLKVTSALVIFGTLPPPLGISLQMHNLQFGHPRVISPKYYQLAS